DVDGVVQASRRLGVARQVHTDLVRDALVLRRRPMVRLFRFSRKHTAPRFFDIDSPELDGYAQNGHSSGGHSSGGPSSGGPSSGGHGSDRHGPAGGAETPRVADS